MKEQIWLTGFMGTGKSRIARPLAAALDWAATDVDELVVQRTGDSIEQIFEKGGEAAFRVIESEVIEELVARTNVVVATGGGAVLAESNRSAMRRRGFVVCLEARPETIASRVRADAASFPRPLLGGGDPLAKIIEIKAERQALYAQADFIIQTDDLTPDQVTHQVLTAFREQSAVGAGGHPI
jgi:shikimate kinase